METTMRMLHVDLQALLWSHLLLTSVSDVAKAASEACMLAA
jgi:hypothetical protein